MSKRLVALITACLISLSAVAQDAQTIDPPDLKPSGNDSVVYFYRSNMIGGAIKFWAFVDEIPIGMLRGRQYTGAAVPSGNHVIWARSGNVSAVRLELEPGQTYYFRIGTNLGAIKARADLEQKGEAEALSDIEDLPFRQLTQDGIDKATEIASEEYGEAIQEAEPADIEPAR